MLAGFVGNLSISSMLSNLLAYNCSQDSLMIFVSLWHWLLFLLFHLFYFPGSSPFSSWGTSLKVYQFCLSFQKTSSWFHLSFLFLAGALFYLFPFWSFLFLSFCWLWGFVCSLSIPLDGRLGCIRDFFCFLRKACIAISFPLKRCFCNILKIW